MISELFLAESKSQVYGALHSFFLQAPQAASKISKHCKNVMVNNFLALSHGIM